MFTGLVQFFLDMITIGEVIDHSTSAGEQNLVSWVRNSYWHRSGSFKSRKEMNELSTKHSGFILKLFLIFLPRQ
ncbi:hypothetical protein RJT34_07487 [Clitoria ternatea]|uniref:Uncharacterized protein n=1 Tax=Clitoria ternatea TaxID=43366 RepID=A0AAN9K6L8_CLITE